VRFDHADDYIFAAAVPPDGLTQHAVGLAHTRRVPEKELEHALFFFGRRLFQPLVGSLWHSPIVIEYAKIVESARKIRPWRNRERKRCGVGWPA